MPHRVAESTYSPYATQSGREHTHTLCHTEWQRAHTHPTPHRVAESTHTPYATQSGREYILTLHHTEWQRAHTHPYSTESGKEKLFRDRVDEGDTHAMFQTQRQLQIHEKR